MNLSPECPECGGTRSVCRNASMDSNGNRIRHRRCGDCGEFFTTLEIAVPFSYSGADSLKRIYHGTKGPARRATDFFSLARSPGRGNWSLHLWQGKKANTCRKGLHELEGDNVYVNPRTGHRVCQTCRRESANRRYANKVAKMPPAIREDMRAYWRADNNKRRRKEAA